MKLKKLLKEYTPEYDPMDDVPDVDSFMHADGDEMVEMFVGELLGKFFEYYAKSPGHMHGENFWDKDIEEISKPVKDALKDALFDLAHKKTQSREPWDES